MNEDDGARDDDSSSQYVYIPTKVQKFNAIASICRLVRAIWRLPLFPCWAFFESHTDHELVHLIASLWSLA